MEKVTTFLSQRSASFPSVMSRKSDLYLPIHTKPQPKFRLKALLGHCLYRRVVIWGFVIIILITATLCNRRIGPGSKNVLELVHLGQGQIPASKAEGNVASVIIKQDSNDQKQEDNKSAQGQIVVQTNQPNQPSEPQEGQESGDSDKPHWLSYKHLDAYFKGIKAIVPFSDYQPEYPKSSGAAATPVQNTQAPKPTIYRPQPNYDSDEYKKEFHAVQPCFLDQEKKIPVPDLHAYNGIPQGQAKAAIGSYDLLGIREDVCFDRFGRYGPYGLGYEFEAGGTGEGLDTEREGSEVVWEKSGKINYDNIDWASAQARCYEDNKARFFSGNKTIDQEYARKSSPKKIDRTAVVIRLYVGFDWTAHVVLNFRAMISELSLKSGGEYDVHFLLHVKDDDAPIWASPEEAQKILDANVPPEFHGLCTLWSEAQMSLIYPGDFGDTFENPSNADIHGVYRSAHMPLQHFAQSHPEYAHYWNWEMDMRWTGSYYELFDRLGRWAEKQSRQGMWERASKYYIPALHGDWENFTKIVNSETEASGRRSIMGPVLFSGKSSLLHGETGFLPAACSTGSDMALCGVGESADLITLNPLFDANESGWVFAGDVTGYDTNMEMPPRRCAIVTASRLSRRLLSVMHEETWRLHHSMFAEMFPATMALHHGLKAVYAPHPVFLDREWPLENIEKAFNGGRDHTSGGHGSPFDLRNEHNHRGTSWYYNSEFAGLLWRRWLGYAQMDGRGNNGGRSGEGDLKGGIEQESDQKSTGRMCLRSMLVHPIKWENPIELQ